MTDAHMRILRLVAQQQRRELADHDAGRTRQAPSEVQRRRLQRAATRARREVVQAEARRRGRRSVPGFALVDDAPEH